jgi:hypothetical protein
MPEVENKPKNLVKNRSQQGHFEGQDTIPLIINVCYYSQQHFKDSQP